MLESKRVLPIVVVESFSSTLVQLAVYFYARDQLKFENFDNLWLALAFGAPYVLGAAASHRLSVWLREKRVAVGVVAATLLVHLAMSSWQDAGVLYVGMGLIGLLNGIKWPVLESYSSAGHTPAGTMKAVGRFNLSWAPMAPLALVVSGPLIAVWPPALFLVGAAGNAVSLWWITRLPVRPVHLAEDHPEHASPATVRRFGALRTSSRFTMFSSYAAVWVFSALIPGIIKPFGLGVQLETSVVAVVHAARFAVFLLLERWGGWHDRTWPLVVSIGALLAGFFLTLYAPTLGLLIVGEVILGISAGMVYYAALYYAMVAQRGSVDAGGGHELFIGLGFVLGPMAGLAGLTIFAGAGAATGAVLGMGPVLLFCTAAGLWSLRGARLTRPPERGAGERDDEPPGHAREAS